MFLIAVGHGGVVSFRFDMIPIPFDSLMKISKFQLFDIGLALQNLLLYTAYLELYDCRGYLDLSSNALYFKVILDCSSFS